jgi:hypothetical protein
VTTRRDIIAAVRAEFGRHKFDTFVTDPPSIGQGGRGIVVPGCVQCKLRMETDTQFMRHLEERVCRAIETA